MDTYNPSTAIRTSLADLGQANYSKSAIYEIPLYMIGSLREFTLV
jgi:hypothetical protein